MTVDSTMPIEPVISPSAVTTDAIGMIPDKRIGKNRKSRKTTAAFAAVTKRIGATSEPNAEVEAVWVAKITTAWRKPLEAFFEVGDLLIAAKKKMGHGNWTRMCETKLPFKIDTARRLMDIAADQWLRETAHGPFLPRSWRTLFELTQWSDECLTVALAQGLIFPEMTRADAVNLLTPPRPPPPLLNVLRGPYRVEDFGSDSLQIYLECLEAYSPTVPKIEIFRGTGPRNKWQSWGVEISECPGTRTINIKMLGEYFIIRMPVKVSVSWPEETDEDAERRARQEREPPKERPGGVAERAAEVRRIEAIKKYVAVDKKDRERIFGMTESDLIKNGAFVFSAEAARLLAPKECGGNARDKRHALYLLQLAIKEIEAQGS